MLTALLHVPLSPKPALLQIRYLQILLSGTLS